MRKVDLSQVPYIERKGKKIYQWEKAIGLTLPFVYDEHEGEIEIVGKKGSNVTCSYLGEKYITDIRYIKTGQIQKFFSNVVRYQYDVGTRIIDKKRDMVITSQQSITKKHYRIENKIYSYYCNICHFDSKQFNVVINERSLNKGAGCSCCAGKIVIKGINDVATTHPELIDYLVDKENGYKYSANSHAKLKVKCKICKKEKPSLESLNHIASQGYSCPYCSDGISYPEKFVGNILFQNNIDYIRQASKKHLGWCKNYRYDFYLPAQNIIIETHGDQHYDSDNAIYHKRYVRDGINDKEKRMLALSNGIFDYIELDCRKSNVAYIKNSILNSALLNYIDMSKTNFEQAGKDSISSYIFNICKEFSESPNRNTKRYLVEKYKIDETTINRYLVKGKELNLFEAKKMRVDLKYKSDVLCKPIKVIDFQNDSIYYYRSVSLFSREYKKIFGKSCTIKCIYQVLNKRRETYDNLYITYCTKEEFNQHAENNNDSKTLVVGKKFDTL